MWLFYGEQLTFEHHSILNVKHPSRSLSKPFFGALSCPYPRQSWFRLVPVAFSVPPTTSKPPIRFPDLGLRSISSQSSWFLVQSLHVMCVEFYAFQSLRRTAPWCSMIFFGPADTEVFRRRCASLTWTQSANSRTLSFPLRLSTALGIAELRQYQDGVPGLCVHFISPTFCMLT